MITSTSRVHLSCNGLASTTLRDHERKKGGRRRSETTANWANSLSRRHNLALFFSPYSLYSRGSLVRPIVPSFTHILPLSHERWGRFISYLLNFIKHPGRQHGCIFHFLISTGIARKGSVAENGERGGSKGGGGEMTTSDHSHVFPSSSVVLLFLVSLSPSLSSFYSPVPACTRVRLFLSSSASQRELGVTIQSTCFTFKSSCRARYLESRSRNGVCTLRLLKIYNFPRKGRAVPAGAPSVVGIRSVRVKMKEVQNDLEAPTR